MKTSKQEHTSQIKLTPEIRKRIKELQKKKNYTDRIMASELNISISRYKNITRTTGGNTYLNKDLLARLSQFFDCTSDYIICQSNNPSLTRNNKEVVHPISFSEKEDMLAYISDYLYQPEHTETLRSLYLILAKLPIEDRKSMINAINSIAKLAKPYTVISCNDSSESKDMKKLFKDCIEQDNSDFTSFTIKLAEANNHFIKHRFAKALYRYIDIIFHGPYVSRDAVKTAISRVNCLSKDWKCFPRELFPIIDDLIKASNSNTPFYSPKVNEIMEKYLNDHSNLN